MNSLLNQQKKNKITSIKNILTLLALGIIVYIISNTDFVALWLSIKELPLSILIIMIFLQLVTQFSLNYQWYRLCKVLNLKASFLKLLVINGYGMVADAITPGEKVGGEVARVVQLNRMLGYHTNQSTSLVTIQKALSLTALIFLNIAALITLSGQMTSLQSPITRITLIGGLLVLAVSIIYLLFFTSKLNMFIQKRKWNSKVGRWLKNWIYSFAKDTEIINKQPKEWFFQLVLSFGIWVLFPIKLYILVSQYTTIHIFVLFATTFVSYFAAMIPLLPGGLGTFEGTMSGILLVYGLSLEESVAISLVFRFVTFWFVVLFSITVIMLWKLIQFRKKRRNETE